MFKGKGHGFFCRCETCKVKRRLNIWYMAFLVALLVIVMYQALLIILFTTRLNAIILFIELLWLLLGCFRIF